jgi:thiol-disulfide isomerase/thioredoxin
MKNKGVSEKMNTVTEWCPHCDNEVELEMEFKTQFCSNCKNKILPCAQCENHKCSSCPLEHKEAQAIFIGYDIPLALDVKWKHIMPILSELYEMVEYEGDSVHLVGNDDSALEFTKELLTIFNSHFDINLTADLFKVDKKILKNRKNNY